MSQNDAVLNATAMGCSLTCKDLAASLQFYHKVVGFAIAQQYERDGQVVGAVVSAGDIRIVLNQDDGKLGWDRIKGQGFYLQNGCLVIYFDLYDIAPYAAGIQEFRIPF